jgi:hypothetical protein
MHIHELLTVGSVALAIVNVGVMWAMAHQWRYAWHSNLALQLLWLPYDYLTGQYGLLGLGVIITFVSLKGAFRENQLAKAAEAGQPSHRRPPRHGASRPRVPSGPAAVTVPEDAADLAGDADLAGISVSAGATIATDRDADGHQERSAVPRIPQQADRRTALDGQSRPRLP